MCSSDLLDRHLREVVSWIDRSTPIDLAAIGIKHDVRSHYDNAVRIDDVREIGAAIIELIDNRLVGGSLTSSLNAKHEKR